MPTARRGTVVDDPVSYIKAAQGTMQWKGEKDGVIRVPIARVRLSFDLGTRL